MIMNEVAEKPLDYSVRHSRQAHNCNPSLPEQCSGSDWCFSQVYKHNEIS